MRATFFRLLAAALALAAAGPAPAQSYRMFRDQWEEVQKLDRWRIGPVRFQPLLQLKNIGYDNNIYFQDRPTADYTGTLSPELRAYWPLRGTILLYARENPEYTLYLKDRSRRELNNSYAFGARVLLLNRFVLDASGHSERHRRQLSSELGALVTDSNRGTEAGLFYETPRRTSLGVSGFVNDLTYESFSAGSEDGSISRSLDRRERGARAEFNYELFSGGTLFLSGEAKEYRFTAPESAWRNSSSVQGSAGIRFPLTGRMRGTLSLGWKKLRPEGGVVKDFSGWTGRGDLEGRFGSLLARISYSRDSVFSFWTDVLYFVEDRYGGGASFYLTRFLRLDYNYERGLGDYPEFSMTDPDSGAALPFQRRDRHDAHTVGLVVRVGRTTGLGLSWSRIAWTSTLPGWNFDRTFIGAYLTANF